MYKKYFFQKVLLINNLPSADIIKHYFNTAASPGFINYRKLYSRNCFLIKALYHQHRNNPSIFLKQLDIHHSIIKCVARHASHEAKGATRVAKNSTYEVKASTHEANGTTPVAKHTTSEANGASLVAKGTTCEARYATQNNSYLKSLRTKKSPTTRVGGTIYGIK